MRLLNTQTFDVGNFSDPEEIEYAILSHKWVDGKELVFEDLKDPAKFDKSRVGRPEELPADEKAYGFSKIAWSASIARERKIGYIWLDTCCIDKRWSTELSESLNSMFKWYRLAVECYAYLPDVTWESEEVSIVQFRESVWFTRGWTLQELLAPRKVRFYDKDWKYFHTKTELASEITSVTNIDLRYLGGDFTNASIATKMSWASRRQTGRPEDLAYCLLGIFDVDMEVRYGEGEYKAFIRLQKELIVNSNDESLFAWTGDFETHGLLAPKPACFSESANITHISKKHKKRPPYDWTNGTVKFPIPSFFTNIDYTLFNLNTAMRFGRRAWGVYVTLNCWRMGAKKSEDTITIHLRKTKNGWQRDHCDKLTLTSDMMVVRCFDWFGHDKSVDYFIAQGEPI